MTSEIQFRLDNRNDWIMTCKEKVQLLSPTKCYSFYMNTCVGRSLKRKRKARENERVQAVQCIQYIKRKGSDT